MKISGAITCRQVNATCEQVMAHFFYGGELGSPDRALSFFVSYCYKAVFSVRHYKRSDSAYFKVDRVLRYFSKVSTCFFSFS